MQASPQHRIINVQPVHNHVNWAWNFIMTISRSIIYYGSLGISQPIIHLCQQWHIHLYQPYTYINIHSHRHALIPTYTYINHLPLPLACQHKQHKQYKQTHQHDCSKTVITFHIIHYQVLRHQECAHCPKCNQYWKPFHDSTSEKCALSSSVCHVGPIHTQAIGHIGY